MSFGGDVSVRFQIEIGDGYGCANLAGSSFNIHMHMASIPF